MKRRTLPGTIGLGIGSMAGCLSQPTLGNIPADQPTDPSPTPTNRNMTERVTVVTEILSNDGYRKPHGIVLKNATENKWTTRLLLERDGERLLDGLNTLQTEAGFPNSETDTHRTKTLKPLSGIRILGPIHVSKANVIL